MKFTVLDTETTGLDLETAEIIEIAALSTGSEKVEKLLINPGCEIPKEVEEITGITTELVKDAPTLIDALPEVLEMIGLDGDPIIVAHNVNYDRTVLRNNLLRLGFKPEDIPFTEQNRWLCTLRLSRKIFADTPRIRTYKLADLVKTLELEIPEPVTAHRADSDVLMCSVLLKYFIENHLSDLSGDELVAYCWEPLLYKRFPFGKHKGKLMKDIPTDYFIWMTQNMDSMNPESPKFDAELAATIEH